MKRLSKQAFTLVEIMVAVVIIGLLAAISIPAFQRVHWSSREKAIINNARQLSGAADQYFMEYGGSTVDQSILIGPTNYMKSLKKTGSETYPLVITAGTPLTIDSVALGRTITYSP